MLYAYSTYVLREKPSSSLEAVAQDNYNDVLSNAAALLSAVAATYDAPLWPAPGPEDIRRKRWYSRAAK